MVVRLIFIVHGCLAYYRVTGKYIFVLFNSHSLTITWPWPKPIRTCLTATVRADSVLPRHFVMAFSMLTGKNWHELCISGAQKSIRGLKMSFPVIFVSFPVKFPPKKCAFEHFIAPKDSSLNFRGRLLSYFWAILLISTVITILEDFGSSYRDC